MRTVVAFGLALFATAASAQGRGGQPDSSRGGGSCANSPYNCPNAANPLPAPNTVWLEEMTWMDVRDALKAGKTTVIIATGGMEPNGPWLVTGKHNYVLHANCEAIARKLGNALCAPIIKYVPENMYERDTTLADGQVQRLPSSGHMRSPGTITLREATYRSMLLDVVSSLKSHGFKTIILIGDSGGNQGGQRAIADSVTKMWKGNPIVAHIEEYYDYAAVSRHMATKIVEDSVGDGLHDDPIITLNMFIDDPKSVRYDERVKARKATINGVSIADRNKNTALAREIVEFRANHTIEAIKKAVANGGTLPRPAGRGRGGM